MQHCWFICKPLTTRLLTVGSIIQIALQTKYFTFGIILAVHTVITVLRSTWMTTKINGVATDLFCTGVIGYPEYMFLN